MRSGILLLIAALIGVAELKPISLYKSSYDWDHYIFVMQYPAGWCAYNNSRGKPCGYPSNASDWTIHGLWPTLGDTKGPNSCNQSSVFEMSDISDLYPKLTIEWTDLFNSTPYYSFWKHEWIKHGTCSDYRDEHSFFTAVLNIRNNLQFGQILSQSGISPSTTSKLDLDDFLNAFKDNLGAYPYDVDCKYTKGVQYLVQVGVCLDRNTLKVINCPSKSAGTCKNGEPIIYSPSIYS